MKKIKNILNINNLEIDLDFLKKNFCFIDNTLHMKNLYKEKLWSVANREIFKEFIINTHNFTDQQINDIDNDIIDRIVTHFDHKNSTILYYLTQNNCEVFKVENTTVAFAPTRNIALERGIIINTYIPFKITKLRK